MKNTIPYQKNKNSVSPKRSTQSALHETTILLFNKPYGVLSQFTSQEGFATLSDFIDLKSVYPAGRLDKDSEGLLLLTNDGKLQSTISHPAFKMEKEYWVQVENIPTEASLSAFRSGLHLKDGLTRPAIVSIMPPPPLWERTPPIRERLSIPTCWLKIIIKEGKNRQVRRMTAAIGHPTLRLVRYRIGDWKLDNIPTGHYQRITKS